MYLKSELFLILIEEILIFNDGCSGIHYFLREKLTLKIFYYTIFKKIFIQYHIN
jgi:hypothetical protein